MAVVLYEYTADGTLEEMVYMPINTTYQQLKEDFADYGYVSSRGIYYFTVANTVYAYNMTAKRLEKIAENVKENTFMTMEQWQIVTRGHPLLLKAMAKTLRFTIWKMMKRCDLSAG